MPSTKVQNILFVYALIMKTYANTGCTIPAATLLGTYSKKLEHAISLTSCPSNKFFGYHQDYPHTPN
jgi:hypothetical protein